jgi:hypothetical protein
MAKSEQVKPEITKLLDSIEINGYRGFKSLSIPMLGRVNLITGKNNVGKSSLLEAIYLLARRGSPEAFWEILCTREIRLSDYTNQFGFSLYEAIGRMLNGRNAFDDKDQDQFVKWDVSILGLGASKNIHNGRLNISLLRPKPETDIPVGITSSYLAPVHANSLTFALNRIIESDRHIWEIEGALPSKLLGSRGLTREKLGQLWDDIALTEGKDDVINGLQIIDARIEDISLTGDIGIELGRVPNARIRGDVSRHSFSEFGDGMNRLFENLVALANVSNGIFLVDEIENGLHYSVLQDVWELIFKIAHRLNVQVFATTHSWECIEAFQAAAAKTESDVALVRLQNRGDDITATVFDDGRLEVAARDQIEIR